jgi:uncharacterized membrane protein YhaH (DUF805 family)
MLIGIVSGGAVTVAIAIGSHGFAHFDPAVIWYAVGSILAAFAVGYRFALWARRPPTRMYLKRGLELAWQSVARRGAAAPPASASELPRAIADKVVAQNFIRRRSVYRWIMHLCLSGGCTLAFAITFPLVFGWVHFTTLPNDAEIYQMRAFGVALDSFHVHGVKAFLAFNLLNFAALAVLVGLIMAVLRRLTDRGERATQRFLEDWLPLLLIFAVTATGLLLTVSYKILDGRGHSIIAVAHMVSVLALIFHIPFGKLFHMFQRVCSLCVSLYRKAGEKPDAARAFCVKCREDFASQMHVDDLKAVLDELGFSYRFTTRYGEVHYQDICPACRRSLLALNQGKSIGR